MGYYCLFIISVFTTLEMVRKMLKEIVHEGKKQGIGMKGG